MAQLGQALTCRRYQGEVPRLASGSRPWLVDNLNRADFPQIDGGRNRPLGAANAETHFAANPLIGVGIPLHNQHSQGTVPASRDSAALLLKTDFFEIADRELRAVRQVTSPRRGAAL